MKNENMQSNTQLPSMGKLIKSTILAVFIATAILITVVLPAEYGIDPTGIGNIIGLVKMGEIKVSLAQEASIEREAKTDENVNIQEKQEIAANIENKPPAMEADSKNDKITVTLKPDEGKEIKLRMAKGSTVNYTWYTDGGKANFDAHADSKKLEIKYHNYEKGKLNQSEGVLEAAFDGNHGWFWRNRTSETMIVTLEVNGGYSDLLQY